MADERIDVANMIDLDRYSILEADARSAIVSRARASMAEEGSAVLPGFVRECGIAAMREEALALAPTAHRRERELVAYPEDVPDGMDSAHPVRRKSPYRMHVAATDQMNPLGPTLAIYEWPPLAGLVADMLELPELHVVADPMMRCNFTYLGDGDEHGWHFDGNDFVVSLMVQPAEHGGLFEFAPNVRDDGRPNYGAVRDVMDEKPGTTRLIRAEAGTLALFRGRRSLHRVTRVRGDRQRIIALLSYHRTPGLMNGPEAQRRVFNRAYGEPAVA